MKTALLLASQFDCGPLIPVDMVREQLFPHLSTRAFHDRLDDGRIGLPVVRPDDSQKSRRFVPIEDLAAYLDDRIAQARVETRRKND